MNILPDTVGVVLIMKICELLKTASKLVVSIRTIKLPRCLILITKMFFKAKNNFEIGVSN